MDVIREESRQAVEALHEMGIEVTILTGDSEDGARAVAEDRGIDTYFAEVLPEDRDKKMIELQEQGQGQQVAMVGDGVNDAPTSTRADIGIAIGSETDVAVEAAESVLVQNNPLEVVRLIRLSLERPDLIGTVVFSQPRTYRREGYFSMRGWPLISYCST